MHPVKNSVIDKWQPEASAHQREYPKIGQYWSDQRGIFAGICRSSSGESDYGLVLVHQHQKCDFTWTQAINLASNAQIYEHKDLAIPTKEESALLYANLKDIFDSDSWYWTATECLGTKAWAQHFGFGSQFFYEKFCERKVCLVRKTTQHYSAPIQTIQNHVHQ